MAWFLSRKATHDLLPTLFTLLIYVEGQDVNGEPECCYYAQWIIFSDLRPSRYRSTQTIRSANVFMHLTLNLFYRGRLWGTGNYYVARYLPNCVKTSNGWILYKIFVLPWTRLIFFTFSFIFLSLLCSNWTIEIGRRCRIKRQIHSSKCLDIKRKGQVNFLTF